MNSEVLSNFDSDSSSNYSLYVCILFNIVILFLHIVILLSLCLVTQNVQHLLHNYGIFSC